MSQRAKSESVHDACILSIFLTSVLTASMRQLNESHEKVLKYDENLCVSDSVQK